MPTRDLTRERVISAGLDLLDSEGPEAMTIRRLAGRLGVTPMALYNHVSNKRDLLRAVSAYVLEQAKFDCGDGDWREQIRECFRTFRGICLRHPAMPRLLEAADVAPPAVFAPMEVTLRALREAGLTDQDALRAYFTLVGFTLSHTSYQTRRIPDLEVSENVRAGRLAGRGYRSIEALPLAGEWDFDAAFEFGVSLILDGVESYLRKARG